MDFEQFLAILKARRRVVFYTLLATVVVALVGSLLWPKSYTGTTTVVLDQKPDPLSGMAMAMGGLQSMTYMSTQIEIISSERVAEKVVKTLKIEQDPDAIALWKDDTDGKGDLIAWLGRKLLKRLDVKPQRDSNVVDIQYTAKNPKAAAEIANTFARAYVDTTLELKIEPARQYATWFVEKTKAMRDDLKKAQDRLSEAQQAKGIVAVDDKLDIENARLAELSTQLATAQGASADSESRQHQATGDASILPEVLQSSLVQTLKADIARGEAKQQELAGQLGKNHPQYKRAEMELQSLRKKLQFETSQVASSIGSTNRVSIQREVELRAAIEKQKTKVLELKKQHDEMAVLQHDVENAQHSYEIVMQRLNQSSLESQANQTNVQILHPANEPVEPSSPRLILNLFVAVFVGLPLGIGLALRREMLDYRIRLPDDVMEMLKLPLLGIIESSSMELQKQSPPRWLRWIRRSAAAHA